MGKRIKGKKGKGVSPINLETLWDIKRGLKALRLNKVGRACVWAVCLVAFWGAFRLGELLVNNRTSFDKYSDLLWENVSSVPDQKRMSFQIKGAKVKGPPGNCADLYELDSPVFCPVRAMRKLERCQKASGIWGKSLPVFRRASGKGLTKNRLLRTLHRALRKVGKGDVKLSCKSFRSGILSALKSLLPDFQETDLKLLGRWRGDSYKFYMWKRPVPFAKTFKSVSEILLKDFECCRNPAPPVVEAEGPQQ